MKKYVAIYGGSTLSPRTASFVEELSFSLLNNSDITLVTGGFDYFSNSPGTVSTDRSAVEGARRLLKNSGIPLEERVETWLPEANKDREGVARFREGKIRELEGRSAQARRFTLVREVDATITIYGDTETAMILDFALAVDKPVFPLPFTGGDSLEYWKNFKPSISKWFRISRDFAAELEVLNLENLSLGRQKKLISKIISALKKGIERQCLILMPFASELDQFYKKVIERTVLTEGFEPIRIDKKTYTGSILPIFLRRLNDCDAIIADVTGANPNVMYELGHAHALKIKPLLISREQINNSFWEQLPFYLREEKIEFSKVGMKKNSIDLAEHIKRYLKEIKNKGKCE